MKKQRGQVIIEFALILPLFLLMIFGLIYSGMLFYDYSTLSNVARSAAREAAISDNIDDTEKAKIIGHYYVPAGADGNGNKFVGGLITSLYVPQGEAFNIDVQSNGAGQAKDIVVTINMHLNTSLPWIDIVLPEDFKIRYHMRRDVKDST